MPSRSYRLEKDIPKHIPLDAMTPSVSRQHYIGQQVISIAATLQEIYDSISWLRDSAFTYRLATHVIPKNIPIDRIRDSLLAIASSAIVSLSDSTTITLLQY